MKLLHLKRDWRDEFDVYGLRLMTDELYALWVAACASVGDEPGDYYFGTNEGWEDDSINDAVSHINVVDVTTNEGNVLEFHLPKITTEGGYGNFPELLEHCTETPEVKAYWEYINE